MNQVVLERPETVTSVSGPLPGSPARARLDSIDLLRGIVIVLMALDHVKGNVAYLPFEPLDLDSTTPAYFVTRWVTHFCAPVFVFLAGTGAFLFGARGRTKGQVAWFLLSRGLWLVFLELTVIRFSWVLNLDYTTNSPPPFGQVIWAIGWSMVVLAGLVFLPISAITVFGLAMIVFHNLSDGVTAAQWGNYDWVWRILHTGETIQPFRDLDPESYARLRSINFWPFYPLIPWIGVLATGYGFGSMMLLDQKRRRKEIIALGIALTMAFVALRWANVYGDFHKPMDKPSVAGPWTIQHGHDPLRIGPWWIESDWLYTVFSFVNCQKYPPSLDFLLMTLGPALILLGLFEFKQHTGPIARFFVVFGRVPLFFYLLHWFVIKGVAMVLAYLNYGRIDFFFGIGPPPDKYGYDLPIVYAVWFGVVLFLFPLCWWFAGVKRNSRAAWLSYF